MKTKKKKTRKSIRAAAALALVLLGAAGQADAKKKTAQPAAPQAVISGTVFREPGFALRGAKITVRRDDKTVENQTVSSVRGEWAVRVPTVPMTYVVDVQANGYAPQQKTVVIDGEEREEINFLLAPVKGGDPAGGTKP